ncbi:MAG: hypothetical protein DHS20C16_15820 [Phycisphaerae bacterium]|nr:MAG: hypothetical protein DHS20C16_15820 [Phycisphaerae bacterium]
MMIESRRCAVGLCLLATLFIASTARATVTVSLELPSVAPVVGETFDVQVVADLPNPILGWGLDFGILSPAIATLTNVQIGDSWLPIATSDGDGLGGVAFPGPISGAGVVLATVTLEATAEGTSDLLIGDDHLIDLTEGFALAPDGFAAVDYVSSSITIVPEPTSLGSLCVLIGLALRRRRCVA